MAQHVADRRLVRPVPADLALVGSATHTIRQLDVMIDQIPQNAINRAATLEDIEDQLDCCANLFVRIERDLA